MEKTRPTLEQLDQVELETLRELYQRAATLAVELQVANETLGHIRRKIADNAQRLANDQENLKRTVTEVAFLETTLGSFSPQTTQIEDPSNVLLYAMYGYDGTYVMNGGDRDYVLSITNPPEQGGHYDYRRHQFVNLDPDRAEIILVSIQNALAQKNDEIARLKQEIPVKENALATLIPEELAAKQILEVLERNYQEAVNEMNDHEQALFGHLDYAQLLETRLALYQDQISALPRGNKITKYVTPHSEDGKIPLVNYDENPKAPINRLLIDKDLYQKDLLLLRPLPGASRISLVWYGMFGGQDIIGYLDNRGSFTYK